MHDIAVTKLYRMLKTAGHTQTAMLYVLKCKGFFVQPLDVPFCKANVCCFKAHTCKGSQNLIFSIALQNHSLSKHTAQ